MKPVIERLGSGGGIRVVTLPNFANIDPIGDLSSSLGGECALVFRIFLLIKNKMSRYFLGIKNQKKSGSEQGEPNSLFETNH